MNPYSASAGGLHGSTVASPYLIEAHAEVNAAAVELLGRTRPWVLFLGILSFLGSALLLFTGLSLTAMDVMSPRGGTVVGALLGAVYIPMASLYIYPAVKLYRFAGAITRLRASRSNVDLEAALSQQKSFWKFVGILAIVMIAAHLLLVVGVVIFDMAGAAG